MFNNTKYTKIYNSIIDRASTRNLDGYIEKHHIIPRSLGGTNLSENIARLTAREHFICHWLLTKMLSGKQKAKMYHALNLMIHVENKHQKRHKVTSHMYAIFKKKYAVILSERSLKNNPMHDPKAKKRHQAAIDKRGPTIGNTGNKASNETKEKMRNARAKQVITEETKEKLRQINTNRDYAPGNSGQVSWYNPETKIKKFFDVGIAPGNPWVKGSIPKPKVTCPHCGKIGSRAPMGIWHFDKCKKRIT